MLLHHLEIVKMLLNRLLHQLKWTKVRTYCVQTSEKVNSFCFRSHTCGELRASNVGANVTLCGWVQHLRMNLFLVVKDSYGATQVVLNPKFESLVRSLSMESVVRVNGSVARRPAELANQKMATGDIEVVAEDIQVLNSCRPLPFQPRNAHKVKESLRLEHRYIDLRSSQMQNNLRVRSEVILKMRKLLCEKYGFVDVETPTLFRRTPGGAREFIVPTHKKGKFYCLTQSPQQFKQLLMVGAIDRYFQIAKCYRDETSRSDRQPEFTQVDLEMSFVTQQDVMGLVEKLIVQIWPSNLAQPFPVMSYDEAMDKYGTDKPDLRYGMLLQDVTDVVGSGGGLLNQSGDGYGVKAVVVPAAPKLLDQEYLEGLVTEYGAKVKLLAVKVLEGETWSVETDTSWRGNMNNVLKVKEGDVIYLCAGPKDSACKVLGQLRIAAYESTPGNADANEHKFLWVVDFPLFEKTDDGRIESSHHPFTAPIEEHQHHVFNDPLKAKGQHYDLVVNGCEVGGGSIRIHDANLQKYILQRVLKEDVVGLRHLLHALECGCPPHGGLAIGLDRLMAIMRGCGSIKDVMAFPKSMDGKDLMADAPAPVPEADRKYYNLK